MLDIIVSQVTPQVKATPLTRQNMLMQKLTHAIANKSTKQIIQVDGQKFTIEYRHGAGGNRKFYVIRTTKKESQEVPVGGERRARFMRSLGKPVKMEIQSFVKPIESGAVLEVELSISSRNGGKVVPVAGWADVVEAYVAKVCGELGWPMPKPAYVVRREANSVLLHGEVENGID